jgi:small subunit ribosomal protein S16
VGATKRPAYRVVAIDGRKPRDGRSLEILGFYDPLTEPATVKLEAERVRDWIGTGAQPSDTVVRLLRQIGLDAKGVAYEEAAKPRARKAPAKNAARPAAGRAKASRAESKATAEAQPTPEAAAGDVPEAVSQEEIAPERGPEADTEAAPEAAEAAEAAPEAAPEAALATPVAAPEAAADAASEGDSEASA